MVRSGAFSLRLALFTNIRLARKGLNGSKCLFYGELVAKKFYLNTISMKSVILMECIVSGVYTGDNAVTYYPPGHCQQETVCKEKKFSTEIVSQNIFKLACKLALAGMNR
jgi:hypothetical protein